MSILRPVQARQPTVGAGFSEPDGTPYTTHDLIWDEPISLLLGEPGSGKSTVVRDLRDQLAASKSATVLFFDLHDLSATSIRFDVFGEVDRVETSERGAKVLILDSADETRCPTDELASILSARVKRLSQAGWRVLITSRTAEVAPRIRAIFAATKARDTEPIYYLGPLDRAGAAALIRGRGIDSVPFLERVEALGIESLAANPLVLNLLCDILLSDGRLSETVRETFDRAIDLLLNKAPGAPVWHGVAGTTSIAAIRAATSRIAALAVLSGQPDISIDDESAGTTPKWIDFVGQEIVDGSAVEVDAAALRASLRSGLFASLGSRRTFIHRDIGDYLAADYVRLRHLSLAQQRALLLLPAPISDIPRRLIGLTTWLVRLEPDTFSWLLDVDPVSLTLSGAAATSDETRRIAIRALLRTPDRFLRALPWSATFESLRFPDLAAELRVALSRDRTRSMALRIAEDAFVDELAEPLASIALSDRRSAEDRRQAIRILARHNHAHLASSLTSQLPRFLEDDPKLESLGTALEAFWPAELDTVALVKLLKRPPRYYYGSYAAFLRRLTREATLGDRKKLVAWIAGQLRVGKVGRRDWLMEFSVEIADPAHVDALASTALWQVMAEQAAIHEFKFARAHLSPLNWQKFILYVARMPEDRLSVNVLFWTTDSDKVGLLQPSDVAWLVSAAQRERSANGRRRMISIVAYLVDEGSSEHLNSLQPVLDDPEWSEVSRRFDAVYIHSPYGDELRRRHRARNRTPRIPRDNSDGDLERVKAAIGRAMVSPDLFWQVYAELAMATSAPDVVHQDDIRSFLLFDKLSASDKLKIRRLAKRYPRELDPAILHDAFDQTHLFWSNEALYAALMLPWLEEGAFDSMIDSTRWDAYSDIVITFPVQFANSPADAENKSALLRHAKRAAPAEFKSGVERLVEHALVDTDDVWEISDLHAVYDEDLESELLRLARSTASGSRERAVRLLFESESNLGEKWAIETVRRSTDSDSVRIALTILLGFRVSSAAAELLSLIRRDSTLAKTALEEVARIGHWGAPELEGDDQALLDVWVWLESTYPRVSDPATVGVHPVSAREEMADFRDRIIGRVVAGATPQTVSLLNKLARANPTVDIERYLARAHEAARATAAELELGQVRAMLSDPEKRMVRSSAELREVVVERLQMIGAWVSSEHSQAFALWDGNESAKNPKRETDISTWFAHGLQLTLGRPGAVVNREVDVFPRPGGAGLRNDIRVQATDSTGDAVTVIVEVKGAWNKEILTGLGAQLVAKYLRPSGHQDGVYLAVWARSEEITKESVRKAASKFTKAALAKALASQAAATAPESISVLVCDISPRRASSKKASSS